MKKSLLTIFLLTCLFPVLAGPAILPVTSQADGSGILANGKPAAPYVSNDGQTAYLARDTETMSATSWLSGNPFLSPGDWQVMPARRLVYKSGMPINYTYFQTLFAPGLTADGLNFTSGLILSQIHDDTSSQNTGLPILHYKSGLWDTVAPLEIDLPGSVPEAGFLDILLSSRDQSISVFGSQSLHKLFCAKRNGEEFTIREILSGQPIPTWHFALTADGSTLYFPMRKTASSTSCSLYSLDLTASDSTPKSTGLAIASGVIGGFQLAVSGNGRFLACNDSRRSQIIIYACQDNTLEKLHSIDEFTEVGELSFSENGKYLSFLARTDAASPLLPYRHNRITAENQAVLTEYLPASDCTTPRLSPNGRYLAFGTDDQVLTGQPSGTPELCLADFGNARPSIDNPLLLLQPQARTLPARVCSSYDGYSCLFIAQGNGDYSDQLFLWNANLGLTCKLDLNGLSVLDCRLSGDGSRLFLCGFDMFTDRNVLLTAAIDPDTGETLAFQELVLPESQDLARNTGLACSYDGNILFCQADNGSLLRLDLTDRDNDMTVAAFGELLGLDCDYAGYLLTCQVAGSGFYAWTPECPAPLRFASQLADNTRPVLTLDGLHLFFCQKGQILSCRTTWPAEDQQPELLASLPDGFTPLAFAANGRFLLCRNSSGQLYRLDLITPDVAPAPVTSGNEQLAILANAGVPANLSADGSTLFFLSGDGLLRFAVEDSWTPPAFAPEADRFTLDERCAYGTGDLPIFPLTFASSLPVVYPAISAQTAHGLIDFIPPRPDAQAENRRDGYAVRYTSSALHFFGDDTLLLSMQNGHDSTNVGLKIVINNINDTPFWEAEQFTAGTVAEASSLMTVIPDFHDDDPQDDHQLTVEGLDSQKYTWNINTISLFGQTSTFLEIIPNHDAITREESPAEINFSLRVTDNGTPEAHADLPCRLTVTNVNRLPTLPYAALTRRQTDVDGSVITWSALAPSDEDQEDKDALLLKFSTVSVTPGSLADCHGQKLSESELAEGLPQTRFPLTYQASRQASGSEDWLIRVADPEDESEDQTTLTITLARQATVLTDFIAFNPQGTTPKDCWPTLGKGWNILALNFGLEPEDLSLLLEVLDSPLPAFTWNPAKQAFIPTDHCEPGEPILFFLAHYPDKAAASLNLHLIRPNDSLTFTPVSGWHLRTPFSNRDFRIDGQAIPETILNFNRTTPAPDDNFEPYSPYWLFFP